MIFAMTSISLLGNIVWGHHMYTIGLEINTRGYFTSLTILISLPTGTKIFNWLSTYLGNPSFINLKITSSLFSILFLFMFTIDYVLPSTYRHLSYIHHITNKIINIKCGYQGSRNS